MTLDIKTHVNKVSDRTCSIDGAIGQIDRDRYYCLLGDNLMFLDEQAIDA